MNRKRTRRTKGRSPAACWSAGYGARLSPKRARQNFHHCATAGEKVPVTLRPPAPCPVILSDRLRDDGEEQHRTVPGCHPVVPPKVCWAPEIKARLGKPDPGMLHIRQVGSLSLTGRTLL